MNHNLESDLKKVRQNFAKELRKALKKTYGGSMPSLSHVGRDLALNCPYLPQVSNETVRKWLIGATIPNAIAILALADWLGGEVLIPLMSANNAGLESSVNFKIGKTKLAADTLANRRQVNQADVELLQGLTVDDRAVVTTLITALNTRHRHTHGLPTINSVLDRLP